MKKVVALLRLMRPANIVTALADIMLGVAASGYFVIEAFAPTKLIPVFNTPELGWLLLATMGLYGGGVVFNDVFDARLDAIERPERPIPSGIVSVAEASMLGALLLLGGILAAAMVNLLSMSIAIAVAALALLYDAWGKHQGMLGPINMGACRGGNLLLGVSILPAAVAERWYLALIPILYIATITMISRGEVHGSKRSTLIAALCMYSLVLIAILSLGMLPEYNILYTIPFLLLFALIIFPPLIKALRFKKPMYIMKSVKAGVLALIAMDATIAAGFLGITYGLVVLALLPLSIFVARRFAVT
jgi:4-hydroxybenzoate polyprenyltransferase